MEVCKTIVARCTSDPKRRRKDGQARGQRPLLRDQQGRQVRRRLDLSRRQDGRARRRLGPVGSLRSLVRQGAGAGSLIDPPGGSNEIGPPILPWRHDPRAEVATVSHAELDAELRCDQYWSDEMTSPPCRVTSPRRVTGLTESLRNATWPSPNRMLAPPGWNEAISSLLPALLPWAMNGAVVPVGRARDRGELVIGRAGDAVTLVGLGPAPVAAIGGIAARGTGVDGVDQGHGGLPGDHRVPVSLGVGAEVARITSRVLGDGDGVAGAVGDLGDPRLALLEQAVGPEVSYRGRGSHGWAPSPGDAERADVGVHGRAVVVVAVAAVDRENGSLGSVPSRPPSGERVDEGQRKTATTCEAPV